MTTLYSNIQSCLNIQWDDIMNQIPFLFYSYFCRYDGMMMNENSDWKLVN